MAPALGVRWTIGDARPDTIAALERSMRSAEGAFGRAARLAVCVHSVGVDDVRESVRPRRGAPVSWLQIDNDVPVFVRRRVGLSMAEGLAWRFAPLRVFAGCSELVVAAECILAGALAEHVRRWAAIPGQRRCLVARHPARAQPPREPPPAPARILLRGVPASFDLEDALEAALSSGPDLLGAAEDVVAAEIRALSCGAPPIVLDARESVQGHASCCPANA